MRQGLLHIVFLFLYVSSFAQQHFEGKITYTGGRSESYQPGAEYSFSPTCLRIDLFMPVFKGEKSDSFPAFTQLYKIDSNLIYFIDYGTKKIQRIIVDTVIPPAKDSMTTLLEEEKMINGYSCLGIETAIDEKMGDGDTTFRIYGKTRSWYARDLAAPFLPWSSQIIDNMIRDGKICLMMESSMIFGKDTFPMEVDMIVSGIEPGRLANSLFTIPASYTYTTHQLSKMLKDTTIQKLELISIRQEEKTIEPPPPPPPPPKKKAVKMTPATKKDVKNQP